MEVVSSILNIIFLLWEGAAGCTNYSYNLEENLNSLRIALGELKDLRDDVLRRVESDEARRMARTNQVRGWLERVEATETEVDEILNEGTILIQRRCLSGCCPKNCLATHKLGKRVVKKLPIVEGLKRKGDFNIVAESLPPASVEALPQNATTGLDLIFEKTWKLLEEDQVGIIGLFGMGGVGKTTLMKKINNEFVKGAHEFDVVIWVVVSKPLNVPRVQEAIMERLGLSWVDTRTQEEQAKYIFEALVKKIYVLLLDDIWERVDLEIVGIPIPNTQNKSKVVFTTRSKAVCGYMEAQKKIKVECLNWDEAWSLFQNKVGEEALNSHPEIPTLAQDVAKECGGLPLALVTIGRAMASKTTPHEWSHAITVLKKSTPEFSDSLRTIPHGEISMLSSLQVFDLYYSNFADWELEHSDVDRSTPSLGELESLKQLKSLGITIKTIPVLQRLLSQNKLRTCTRHLNIKECQGLTSIKLSSSSTPTSILSSLETETTGLGNMTNLRHLRCLEELTISWVAGEEQSCSLSHLRYLTLENLPKLKITWERSQTLLCFENLSDIYISNCDALNDLTWLLHVQSLQQLHLKNCKGIEEVIHGEVTTVKEELNAFSRLKRIYFSRLPNLKSLCRYALPFPSLNQIYVQDCPKLNKLPLDSNSAQNTLQWIRGEQQWWDRLEWEDETIKSIFQHKFQAYGERPES